MLIDYDLSYLASLIGAKVVIKLASLFKRGATALPGYIIEKVNPNFLKAIDSQIKDTVFVSGTNGKTTTSRLIVHLLTEENRNVVSNSAGSNLRRGIISAIVPYLSLNKIFTKKIDFLVFECDEFALGKIISDLKANYIVMTNLFRDQLDRYGEIDTIRKKWADLVDANAEAHFIVNADDPSLTSLFLNKNIKVSYFGLENYTHYTTDNLKDITFCPICGSKLIYKKRYFSHLGNYACENCNFQRPQTTLSAFLKNNSIFFRHKDEILPVNSQLKGDYNIYNMMASTLTCVNLGFDIKTLISHIVDFTTTFGRYEKVNYKGKIIYLILVKNPVGFLQALNSVKSDNTKKNLIFLLNDNIADGTDVSWIWDVDLDMIKDNINTAIVGGKRLYDMGLRLKYADIDFNLVNSYDELFNSIEKDNQEEFYLFLTYTALLETKNYLSKHGFKRFYEQ